MPVCNRHRSSRSSRLLHRPATLAYEPVDEGSDRIGERFFDRPIDDRPVTPVGPRHGEHYDRGLAFALVTNPFERYVTRLAAVLASLHRRVERGVDDCLDGGPGAEARRQVHELGASSEKLPLCLLVERHVCAPKTVDRLFRIPDDEELPWDRTDLPPITLSMVIRSKKKEDLRL